MDRFRRPKNRSSIRASTSIISSSTSTSSPPGSTVASATSKQGQCASASLSNADQPISGSTTSTTKQSQFTQSPMEKPFLGSMVSISTSKQGLYASASLSSMKVYREHYTALQCGAGDICVKHAVSKMPGLSMTLRSRFDTKTCSNLNECGSLSLFGKKPSIVSKHASGDHEKPSDQEANASLSASEVYSVDPTTIKSLTQLLHARDFQKIIQTITDQQSQEQLHSPQPLPHPPYLFLAGLSYFKVSQYKEARSSFTLCVEICRAMNVKGDVSLCYIYMGDVESASKNHLEAAEHYKRAAKDYSEVNMAGTFRMVPPSLSAVYAKRGAALRNGIKMVDGVQAYKMAIEEAHTDKDRLASHTSIGNLYQSLGENDSALSHYEKSVELSTKLKDYVSLGWAHGNIGNAYLGLFKKEKALHHLKKSLELTVEHEHTPQAIGRAFNNLGTAYQSIGELDKAKEHYDRALSQAIYGDDKAGQARVYGNIANILMLKKNYESAIPCYTEVISLSKDRNTLIIAHHNRGCAYYEWAESKMEEKYKSDKTQFYIHGLGFHDKDKQPRKVSSDIFELYRHGSRDLEEVVKHHETSLDNIKGSCEGLTLSVSLFETNSRTFHRYQDCLVNLGEYTQALLVAEQSRARTLGDLMLKRKGRSLPFPLASPLPFDQMATTIALKTHPILYLSYTGARLLGWVFIPKNGDVKMNMFEVPLKDDQFDGKSFDYHLKYNLTDMLVERSVEMYRGVEYNEESSEPVQKLYNLIAKPLLYVLKGHDVDLSTLSKLMVISDSYTALLPYAGLQDSSTDTFLGDARRFQLMPSLLTMCVLDQLSDTNVVRLPLEAQNMCIVGNPNIPPFYHNKELWNLGKLPHAKREAEWVAHILKTTPILGDEATKGSVLMRLSSAKVIHLATHGSASAGFLAFGAMISLGEKDQVPSQNVLLYPQDVEQLKISPALVVLSSCDSGRGTVKADGIQGMARAFILAGAQAVLTTLWRVPDESASVFMQFFYQYMMDGMESTLALQKAILSIRCFSKYSQYIHWSGYQLTGRDIFFETTIPTSAHILNHRLGSGTVFPRLKLIKTLKKSIVNDTCYPTDVQILQGISGVKPSGVVTDFIHSTYQQFRGGIFWINCQCHSLVSASISYIEKCTGTELDQLSVDESNQVLVVLDGMTKLPESEPLLKLMRCRHTHLVILYYQYLPPEDLIRSIDHKLIRGSKVLHVEPLTMIHSTQRIVYTIQKEVHLAPSNRDQNNLEKISDFTSGSPVLVDITSHILLSKLQGSSEEENTSKLIEKFAQSISIPEPDTLSQLSNSSDEDNGDGGDSGASTKLINSCKFDPEVRLLLNCLSVFGSSPIPLSVVTSFSSVITTSSGRCHLASSLLKKLLQTKFIETYPCPVLSHSTLLKAPLYSHKNSKNNYPDFVCVPQHVATFLWKDLEPNNRIIALAACQHVLSTSSHQHSSPFLLGLTSLLLDALHVNHDLMGDECYKEVFRLSLNFLLL